MDMSTEVEKLKKLWQLENDKELAEFLGVSKTIISTWRNGKSDLGAILKLRILDKVGYGWAKEALAALLPEAQASELREFERARAMNRAEKQIKKSQPTLAVKEQLAKLSLDGRETTDQSPGAGKPTDAVASPKRRAKL